MLAGVRRAARFHLHLTSPSYSGFARQLKRAKGGTIRRRLITLGATLAVLAALAVGGSAIATAAEGPSTAPPAESDTDGAAQAAACKAAGIDPEASNVEYDDATGKCSLDTGAENGS